MDKSEGSSSGAVSFYKKKNEGPLCHCKRQMSMEKAWTDDNPGRRFWSCNLHGFVAWIDKEEQNEWQKQSLLEARDVMNRMREEKAFKHSPWTTSQQATIEDSTALWSEEGDSFPEEKRKLETALITSAEKEKLLRQFVVLSWGGFIFITIIIAFAMLKK